jgi:hypothetical protein
MELMEARRPNVNPSGPPLELATGPGTRTIAAACRPRAGRTP